MQESGRAGHLIRAALACTLSGLWGLYAGFELCDATALPGREEYLDSEKYQIRQRDWAAPGNIIAEITALNALRLRHRALQSHMGLRFYTIFNDRIVYFGKMAPGQSDMILVAISLDPEAAQEADFEIPCGNGNFPITPPFSPMICWTGGMPCGPAGYSMCALTPATGPMRSGRSARQEGQPHETRRQPAVR
ncbi:hypothetical protein RAA17_13130 [Komagataeibacter rhaeticus]|nr:hypothetical protein [Komagataeibacter rhaeticus]